MTDDEQIALLELQIERLTELADGDRGPVTHFLLRHKVSEHEERALYRLLEDAWTATKKGNPPNAAAFEQSVGTVLRGRANVSLHTLADDIIRAFEREDKYGELIVALKETRWFG